MNQLQKKVTFSTRAVTAFEKTYSVLFEQALTEAERLAKINVTMGILEEELLDPERIMEMDVSQKLLVFDLLTRTSNTSIRNLMGFSQMFMNIKTVVSILENTKSCALEQVEQESSDIIDIEFTKDDYEGTDFEE